MSSEGAPMSSSACSVAWIAGLPSAGSNPGASNRASSWYRSTTIPTLPAATPSWNTWATASTSATVIVPSLLGVVSANVSGSCRRRGAAHRLRPLFELLPGVEEFRTPCASRLDGCRAAKRPRDVPGVSAGLGPELVPRVKVLEVFSTVGHPAILELEDDAVGNIQVLAVSVRGAALDADHAVLAVCSHVLQFGPEGPSGLLR